MADPIDFEFHRFMKVAGAEIAGYAETLRDQLQQLQSLDISKMNGGELRVLRDRILNLKWLVLVCNPKTREQISKRITAAGADPGASFEELAAFVSDPPT